MLTLREDFSIFFPPQGNVIKDSGMFHVIKASCKLKNSKLKKKHNSQGQIIPCIDHFCNSWTLGNLLGLGFPKGMFSPFKQQITSHTPISYCKVAFGNILHFISDLQPEIYFIWFFYLAPSLATRAINSEGCQASPMKGGVCLLLPGLISWPARGPYLEKEAQILSLTGLGHALEYWAKNSILEDIFTIELSPNTRMSPDVAMWWCHFWYTTEV